MISFIAPFGTEAMAGFGVARNLEYLMSQYNMLRMF